MEQNTDRPESDRLCDEFSHEFAPLRQPENPAKTVWYCTRCPAIMKGVEADVISACDLNQMVDSSLSKGASPYDNQSVKGERWILRAAAWTFAPFRFRILWHELDGHSFVLLFQYRALPDGIWHVIHDTARYAELLNLHTAWQEGDS